MPARPGVSGEPAAASAVPALRNASATPKRRRKERRWCCGEVTPRILPCGAPALRVAPLRLAVRLAPPRALRSRPMAEADHDDPFRMYLVVPRHALTDVATGGVLAGAAAVACLRAFAEDPERAAAIAAWRERPGKVTLRAKGGQWARVLADEPHALAGDPE